ncbi:acetylglutamate semialdehyde dehydrogenase [Hyphomonas jannaschiana VP2]|uniref:Acetylglutamate semialdehyde dehydrogenase n=1 Tax=Hyphomonas jannaschiana VP2 TaxID=1280952 RepID=A0A059F853_9PROT|nr:acetylglutamate semialdehyde dehydrogenase [Hyphomonas jannaschiana VP2]
MHGLGDLLRGFHAGDPVFQVLQAGHVRPSSSCSVVRGSGKLRSEVVQGLLDSSFNLVGESFLSGDLGQQVLVRTTEVSQQLFLVARHVFQLDLVEVATRTGVDHADLLFHQQRRVLRLLEEFGQAGTAVQQALGGSVQVGTEFREGGHLTVLGEFALHGAGNFLHRFRLGSRAHARHRQTDVHGRADTLVEQVRLKEDLAVGDRDHVRRNVGRHVVGLGFNDRQGRQRAGTVLFVQLGSTLQKARVQVEHVTRISFAARRTAQ